MTPCKPGFQVLAFPFDQLIATVNMMASAAHIADLFITFSGAFLMFSILIDASFSLKLSA